MQPPMIQEKSKAKGVVVDGKKWQYIEPGMGSQQRLAQHMSRIKLYGKWVERLDAKIDNDSITEEEMLKSEEYLDKIQKHTDGVKEIFNNTYRDGTEDNASVLQWLDVTPPWKIEKVFQETAQNDPSSTEKAKDKESS